MIILPIWMFVVIACIFAALCIALIDESNKRVKAEKESFDRLNRLMTYKLESSVISAKYNRLYNDYVQLKNTHFRIEYENIE